MQLLQSVRLIPLILLIAFFGRAAAEDLAAGPGFLVRVWQSQDGLPGNVVRSLVEAQAAVIEQSVGIDS